MIAARVKTLWEGTAPGAKAYHKTLNSIHWCLPEDKLDPYMQAKHWTVRRFVAAHILYHGLMRDGLGNHHGCPRNRRHIRNLLGIDSHNESDPCDPIIVKRVELAMRALYAAAKAHLDDPREEWDVGDPEDYAAVWGGHYTHAPLQCCDPGY